jgi:uncharacterized protein (DUF1330 family)
MGKGYWVAHVDVTEPEGYKAYMGADMEAFRKYGGRFLVRGGQFELLEGASRRLAQRPGRVRSDRDREL